MELFVKITILVLIGSLSVESHGTNSKVDDNELALECVTLIKNKHFKTAASKLNTIANINKVWFIVKQVADSDKLNYVDTLIKLIGHVDDVSKKFQIHEALYNEIEGTCNDHYVSSLIKLAISVKRLTTKTALVNANDLLKSIRLSIERVSKAKMISEISIDKFTEGTLTLLTKLEKYDTNFATRIVDGVVEEVHERVSPVNILNCFERHSHLTIKSWGILSIYRIMYKSHNVDSKFVFGLGLAIKNLRTDQNYTKDLPLKVRNDLDTLRQTLPDCVKRVVFSKRVCIKSVKFNEYLYAVDNPLKYDKDRRNVFTWKPGTKGDNGQEYWTFEEQDGVFNIKNVAYKEYLYAAMGFDFDKDRRRVFTWVPGSKDDQGQEDWEFEVKEDYCFIKNVKFDEYLYPIIGFDYDKDRRQVATWIPKSCDDQCLWKIENCDELIIDLDVRFGEP